MKKIIDLRSDTVTRPSEGMREAMFNAEVGDDVFGDDPTVNLMQEKVADLLGKQAAIYMPSGTMTNQSALAVHTRPGDEVYCEVNCHIRNFEGGAPGYLSGVMLNAIQGTRGSFTACQVESLLRPEDHHFPPSRLIWVENTANWAGGAVFPQDEILKTSNLAEEKNLALHLDGARIWNAAAATGKSVSELAEPFDSISVCFSKGMGCPVGSVLAGSRDFIDQAHRFRKRLGGAMRQAGYLAAAIIYAVDHNLTRFTEDHRRARELAKAIDQVESFTIDLDSVQTNIVIFQSDDQPGSAVTDKLKEEGIQVVSFGNTVRFVTHLDVDDSDIERTIEAIRKNFA